MVKNKENNPKMVFTYYQLERLNEIYRRYAKNYFPLHIYDSIEMEKELMQDNELYIPNF